jgi:hypothetical protein
VLIGLALAVATVIERTTTMTTIRKSFACIVPPCFNI